jgi:hypothetical protein
MPPNTHEATSTKRRQICVTFDKELLAHIEQYRNRMQRETGARLSLSQAASSLLRRALAVASEP